MAIRERKTSRGTAYDVRYRDSDGKQRTKTCLSMKEAQAIEADLRARKYRHEEVRPDRGKVKLREFMERYWTEHARPELAPATRVSYAAVWNAHLDERVGGRHLRDIDAGVIQKLKADLRSDGVGEASVRRSLSVLGAVLGKAVEWGELGANPARLVKPPSAKRKRLVHPLVPEKIEAMRSRASERDATLFSLLAYAGLRPGEALALTWEDVGERTLLVDKALSLGEVRATKTGAVRSVPLCVPLAHDLTRWREQASPGLLFPAREGRPWTDFMYRNWRRRKFAPVAPKGSRPYDLRHTAASLWLREGRSPLEVAEALGHSPQILWTTYAHVVAELRGTSPVSADDLIAKARDLGTRELRSVR